MESARATTIDYRPSRLALCFIDCRMGNRLNWKLYAVIKTEIAVKNCLSKWN